MAPLASDPSQLLTVLNGPRRRALYTLVQEIAAWQRSQLELKQPQEPSTAPLFVSLPRHGSEAGDDDVDSEQQRVDVNASQRITAPPPELIRSRLAALAHLEEWREGVLTSLHKIVSAPDDTKIIEERRKRAAQIAQLPKGNDDLLDLGNSTSNNSSSAEEYANQVEKLQALYHPIPTRLTTIPQRDREEVLSCVLVLLLATGNYSAHSRTLVVYLASALALPLSMVIQEETEIAEALVERSTAATKQNAAGGGMSAEAEAQNRKEQGKASRYWKVGLASVAGAAIIGVTGGLAAPIVAGAVGGLMGSVGLGGLASFLGIFWMNGALVGALFGAYGAKMTGEMIDQYAREVEDFRFLPLKDEWGTGYSKDGADGRRLRVTIGINGWLHSRDDIVKPWRALSDDAEVFALRYEVNSLLALGRSFKEMITSYAWSTLGTEIIARTVLSTLWAALWPIHILRLATNIDTPFNLAKNRSDKAGKILADALINKVQGERPVTLVGYSLGARVIYSCLRTLVERRAFGLVDSVVFIGAPVPSNRNHWQMMRSVVSGKMFNVYSQNDLVLAFVYRATSVQLGIAGLQAISDIEGVENLDLSAEVSGHMRYPELVGQILSRCGFSGVKGGKEVIEKDAELDGIKLEDSDQSKTGLLIELDDLHIDDKSVPPAKPPRPSQMSTLYPALDQTPAREIHAPVRSATRTTVVRKKTQTLASDPLAQDLQDSPRVSGEPAAPAYQSQPGGAIPDIGARGARDSPLPRDESKGSSWTRPEAAAEADLRQQEGDDYDYDGDADEWAGITMQDNDEDFNDMVSYTEPIPLED